MYGWFVGGEAEGTCLLYLTFYDAYVHRVIQTFSTFYFIIGFGTV